MTSEADAPSSASRPSRDVTLGRVIAIDELDPATSCAVVEVGSVRPISFASKSLPSFELGDIVAVTTVYEADHVDPTDWVAEQDAGHWMLCTCEQLGLSADGKGVLVIGPGMHLAATTPQDAPNTSSSSTTQSFDMLVVPWWADGLNE
jgi:hypothetical protein